MGSGPVLALALLALNIASRRLLLKPRSRVVRWLLSPAVWLNPSNDADRSAPPFRHAAAAAGTVLLVVAVYVGVNFAKFRTIVDGAPLNLYLPILSDPQQLQQQQEQHEGVLRPANVRTTAHAYFAPWNFLIVRNYPWVILNIPRYTKVAQEAKVYVEPNASVTATSPLLVGLTLLGLFAARRPIGPNGSRTTIPIIGATVGGTLMLAAAGLTERYVHDLFPLLALAGALGVNSVLAMHSPARRRAIWLAAAPLAVWGLYFNLTCALMYQRVWAWGVPQEQKDQYVRLVQFMNRHVGGKR